MPAPTRISHARVDPLLGFVGLLIAVVLLRGRLAKGDEHVGA
jgi:hypothetical protein